MKLLKTILFILFITNISIAQNKNFNLEDGLILWKLVYNDSTDVSQLKNNLLLEFETDSTGLIKRTNFNDKKVKDLEGEFKIESKENKYRVSVYNVRFFVEPMNLYGGGMSMQTISEYTIEESLIKKDGSIRKSSLGYNLTETLNPHFVDLFTIKERKTSDW